MICRHKKEKELVVWLDLSVCYANGLFRFLSRQGQDTIALALCNVVLIFKDAGSYSFKKGWANTWLALGMGIGRMETFMVEVPPYACKSLWHILLIG